MLSYDILKINDGFGWASGKCQLPFHKIKRVLLMSFLMFRLFQFNFRKVGFLTFETVTLVPIQSKMIDPSLLSEKEVSSSLSFSRNSDLSTLN